MQKHISPSCVSFLLIMLTCVVFSATVLAQSPRRRAPRTQNTPAPTPQQSLSTETAVRAVLEAQVSAWNRADIEGFMDGYHRTPDIVFISGDTVARGWATVLERYQRTYNTKEKMGTLAFTDLEIKPLDANHATAIGRFQLTGSAETEPFATGRFTLIFLRTPQGWRIMHDHTSSAEN